MPIPSPTSLTFWGATMTDPNSNPPSTQRPVITQRLLKQLYDARIVKNVAEGEANEHRKELLELYDGGAVVEDGALVLRVDTRERQVISQAAIVDILGQDALDALLAAIEAKTVHTVVVTDPVEDRRKRQDRRMERAKTKEVNR